MMALSSSTGPCPPRFAEIAKLFGFHESFPDVPE
jgi:hypothetical protein